MSVRGARLGKRSFPESAETAEGWLRASGIERGRPNRAEAHGCGHLNILRMAMSSVIATRSKSWPITWWNKPASHRVRSWNSMPSLPESIERRRAIAGSSLLQRQKRRYQVFRSIGKVHLPKRLGHGFCIQRDQRTLQAALDIGDGFALQQSDFGDGPALRNPPEAGLFKWRKHPRIHASSHLILLCYNISDNAIYGTPSRYCGRRSDH